MTRSILLQALLALSVATAFNITSAMADSNATNVEAKRTPDQRQDARQDRREERREHRKDHRQPAAS